MSAAYQWVDRARGGAGLRTVWTSQRPGRNGRCARATVGDAMADAGGAACWWLSCAGTPFRLRHSVLAGRVLQRAGR